MQTEWLKMQKLAAVALLTGLLAACSQNEVILPGERISIVDRSNISKLDVDADAQNEGAQLPEAITNPVFTTPGFTVSHSGGHLSLDFPLRRAFSTRVGEAAETGTEMAQPVASARAVFTVTPGGIVTAVNASSGERIWRMDIDPSSDDTQVSVSGGISLAENDVIVHAGKTTLASLDAATGTVNWSIEMPNFLMGGPSVYEGLILVTDINGRVYALALETGEELWNRIGTPSKTRVNGASFPAIYGTETIIAGGDGELISLSLDQGGFNWGENLVPVQLVTSLDSIADITAHPVHDGGMVISVTQSGIMMAFNARTGRMVWEQGLRSLSMPWLSGGTIYVTTVNNQLYALRRTDGAVRWKVDLPGVFGINEPVVEGSTRYTGPVVASGHVIIGGSDGDLHIYNAENGAFVDELSAGGAVTSGLSIANNTLYVIGRNGKLSAFR